jgi:hypothetical protein
MSEIKKKCDELREGFSDTFSPRYSAIGLLFKNCNGMKSAFERAEIRLRIVVTVFLYLFASGILFVDGAYASTAKERIQERINEVNKTEEERYQEYQDAFDKLGSVDKIAQPWDAFWPQINGSPQDELKKVASLSYSLAVDFPQDKIRVFEDFSALFAFLEESEKNVLLMHTFGKKHSPFKTEDPTPALIVNARLEINNPARYEDLLSAVSMSFSSFYEENLRRSSSYSSFFIKNVLDPLSADLIKKEYRGYHFDENFLQYFSEDMAKPYLRREMSNDEHDIDKRDVVGVSYGPKYRIPNDLEWIGVYARTFWNIYEGKLHKAYSTIRTLGWQPVDLYSSPPTSYRFYSFYHDEDRYQWFLFFQEELRNAKLVDYADDALETELDSYRELIVCQLQERAYFAKKLYESGDHLSLKILKGLLEKEYAALRKDPLLVNYFNESIEYLRRIDKAVQTAPQAEKGREMGVLVLPWINRQSIDRRQGGRR